MELVEFTKKKLDGLKAALQAALQAGKDKYAVFEFDGVEYVVGYATYLIKYLEDELHE